MTIVEEKNCSNKSERNRKEIGKKSERNSSIILKTLLDRYFSKKELKNKSSRKTLFYVPLFVQTEKVKKKLRPLEKAIFWENYSVEAENLFRRGTPQLWITTIEMKTNNKFHPMKKIITNCVRDLDKKDIDPIGVDLRGADLRSAKLSSAKLVGVDLRGADLRGANLIGANLIGADLSNADLSDADLISADLTGAKLIYAKLINTNLIGVNLIDANLSNANLIKADLTGVNLTSAKVEKAIFGRNLGISVQMKNDLIERGAIFEEFSVPILSLVTS